MRVNPPYKHLVQKSGYLCAVTCLQMVLFRRGIWVDQEPLAKELGTRIPKSIVDLFYIRLPVGKNDDDVGTDLKDFVGDTIEKIFKRHNINLRTNVYYIDQIKDVKTFIETHLSLGNDIMFNFSDHLYNLNSNGGHYSLISEINGEIATLCDPWHQNKSYWNTNLTDLIKQTNTIDLLGAKRGIVVFQTRE